MLETIWQDVRYAARSLHRTPGFTGAALLTLALGIGATSAIFTVVNAALLKPPPYPEPDQLLVLTTPDGGSQTGQLFLYVRERLRAFEHLAAQRVSNGWNLVAGDYVTYVDALRVSEGYFDALGVAPLLGRGLSRGEDQPRGPDAVVISEALWRRAYGGRADVLGETIQLGGVPHTIVGIMPAAFRSIPDAEVWTPLRTTATDNTQNYRIVGRLREGVTTSQAAAEFNALRPDIRRDFPRNNSNRLATTGWLPLRQVLGVNVRQPLLMLLGAVVFLLLIACLNVASLQLTRALGRRRELVTRAALGGSPFRLVRQVLVESALLAISGALLGLIVAVAGTQLLFGLVSEDAARQMLSGETANVDWRVFVFALATAVGCSVIFGVAPALASSRVDLRPALGASATTTSSRRTVWLRRTLAGGELALAVVLLVGAGLLLRTLYNLHSAEQ
jgi:putative ABC transport system permease protein